MDIHADIAATGLDNASFDAIICCHVLEHIPDDLAAMRELHRLARGSVYIQVPCRQESQETDEDPSIQDPAERKRRFGQSDHVRVYGRDITERLRSIGFAVTEWRPRDILDHAEMTQGGHWNDILFECER